MLTWIPSIDHTLFPLPLDGVDIFPSPITVAIFL